MLRTWLLQMDNPLEPNAADATEQFGYANFAGLDTPVISDSGANRADNPQFDM